MADISHIMLNGTSYDIKDASAANNITLINNRIDEIEEEIFPPAVRKMIVVSDSYGLGRNDTVPWVTPFAQLVPEFTTVFNWSNGSMGIVRQGDGGYRAKDFMIHHASDVSDPENVTAVVIAMGANDIIDHGNFNTYFDDLHTYINTTYPNAKIYVGFIGNNLVLNVSAEAGYMEVVALYQSAGDRYEDVKYLHGVEYIMHNARLMQSDKVHPTTEGSYAIAEGVACAYRTGSYRYRYYAIVEGTKFSVAFCMDGEVTWIYVSPKNSAGQQFTTISYIDWETLPNPVLYAGHATNFYCFLSAFDSDVNTIGLSLRYSSGVIAIAPTKAGINTLANNVKIFGNSACVPTIKF